MRVASKPPSADKIDTRPTSQATSLPGQVVLVLQGGGALGAYQAGVYQALHEAGIEPDWIIGTSIGAINASLIAGNEAPNRLPRLEEFWGRMADKAFWHASAAWAGAGQPLSYWKALSYGVPGFFEANPLDFLGPTCRWAPIAQATTRRLPSKGRFSIANHIARQLEIHRLRHVISELAEYVPEEIRGSEAVRALAGFGCLTRMHVVRLLAPRLDHEDHTKDVDFTPTGIRKRLAAGYANTRRAIELAPWQREFGPLDGVILHEPEDAARLHEVLGDSTAATPRDDIA